MEDYRENGIDFQGDLFSKRGGYFGVVFPFLVGQKHAQTQQITVKSQTRGNTKKDRALLGTDRRT